MAVFVSILSNALHLWDPDNILVWVNIILTDKQKFELHGPLLHDIKHYKLKAVKMIDIFPYPTHVNHCHLRAFAGCWVRYTLTGFIFMIALWVIFVLLVIVLGLFAPKR